MNQDHFWNLLAKNLANEASEEEKEELSTLLKQYPELAFAAQQAVDVYNLKPVADPEKTEAAYWAHLANQDLQAELNQQNIPGGSIGQRIKKTGKRFAVPFLAAIAMVVTATLLWVQRESASTASVPASGQTQEVYTRAGTRTRVVLPDSSVVWLNAGSKLVYDRSFGIRHRNAALTGEGFFEVKKGSMPFIVRANDVRIKVLGTVFNVRSYPGEATEASLLHGRVEVLLDNRPGEPFILKPNEKLVVANPQQAKAASAQKKMPIVVLKELTYLDEAVVETSWVDNKLIFHDEAFADVARKLERWYNVTIRIENDNLARQIVGGGPFETETVEQALTALQIAFNFRFTVDGRTITIKR